MDKSRAFSLPQQAQESFKQCVNVAFKKCPNSCWEAGINYKDGEFSIKDITKITQSLSKYFKEALKKFKAVPAEKGKIGPQPLMEADDASKNIVVEALKAVSETLDMLKQNVIIAQDKIRLMPRQDIVVTKLKGLGSIVDSSITDISESITQVTSEQTTNSITDEPLYEDAGQEDKGIEMNIDTALKNSDKLNKFTDRGQNVIIDDEN